MIDRTTYYCVDATPEAETLNSSKMDIRFDIGRISESMRRMREALLLENSAIEEWAESCRRAFGLPTTAQLEQQRRHERHMARCARNRDRRRKRR